MNLQGITKFCESSDMNGLIGYKYSRDEYFDPRLKDV